MADIIGIVGQSGSGKSTSIRTLNPEETFIINTIGKPLPFPGSKKKYTKLRKEGAAWAGNLYVSKDPNHGTIENNQCSNEAYKEYCDRGCQLYYVM